MKEDCCWIKFVIENRMIFLGIPRNEMFDEGNYRDVKYFLSSIRKRNGGKTRDGISRRPSSESL
jgi:hypothetical protein